MKNLVPSVVVLAAMAVWSQAQAPAAVPAAAPAEAKAAEPAKSSVKLEKIVAAAGVENREATGEATSFGADVGQVYCWTKLSIGDSPAKIKYVWSKDGKQVHEHQADIASSGRWWSAKKVQAGSWKVEVVTESGESLGSVDFTVGGDSKAAAPASAAAPAKSETK
jgi:hypothetical protein